MNNQDKPNQINPGIIRTVEFLNDNGFRTIDSGDGETHDFACDRSFGYVSIMVDDHSKLLSEAVRLKLLLSDRGVNVQPIGKSDEFTYIQATFDPADGTSVIDISNITDKILFHEIP